MCKIAIIHFQPLELYPPVQNLIRFLEQDKSLEQLYVYSTYSSKDIPLFHVHDKRIKIIRLAETGQELQAVKRYWNYFKFYTGTLFHLVKKKAGRVLYFETLSSFPAVVYKKLYRKHVSLLVHYHEYTSPREYETSMKLNRIFHQLEKKEFPEASWVSHTNQYRMDMFIRDMAPVKIPNTFILPNYPPMAWKEKSNPHRIPTAVTKIIYAGAVSMDTMYTREFADWVTAQNGKVIWDIYSLNITAAAADYLRALKPGFVNLKPGVTYEDLPGILCQYDVGVVLYKGHIPNYVYNAPNKIFEYLAAGLDVWFPDIMTGSKEYITKQTYPKVMALNFSELRSFDLLEAIQKKGFAFFQHDFFCENILGKLREKLVADA
ncbi:MAG: hypothetical protein QM791_02705 [Ferruginibacter sp.]